MQINALTYLLICNMQGNSNSLSTVDIAAGYIGLKTYCPTLIGLLMCLNTYAGPIYWFLALQSLLAELYSHEVKQ